MSKPCHISGINHIDQLTPSEIWYIQLAFWEEKQELNEEI